MRQTIYVLSTFTVLAPREQGPDLHFYIKIKHLVYCYTSFCHSVKICLYVHDKNCLEICTTFDSHQNQLQFVMLMWKEGGLLYNFSENQLQVVSSQG